MKEGNLFIADGIPPFQNGGMETHAAEYIRHYGEKVIPYSFELSMDHKERDLLLSKYHLSHARFTLPRESIWNPDILNAIIGQHNPEFVFFNSIYWIKVLEQLRAVNSHVRFILRSGGNDISQSNIQNAPTLEERRRFVVNAVNRNIDTLIVNSLYTQARFEEYGINVEKMKVITGGVDIQRFQPVSNEEKENIRKKLGLPVGKPIGVAISRFVPFKNIQAVLQVAMEVTEKTDSYFLFVGSGPLADEVRTKIQQFGLAQRIIFVGDIPAQDIAEYYQAGDYFLQMSTYTPTSVQSIKEGGETYIHTETMGRSAMEAMATGLPVIATAVGGVPEVLQDSGVLIPDNDTDSAIQAICELLENPLLAKQIRDKGRNIARDKFSWGSVFNQYE